MRELLKFKRHIRYYFSTAIPSAKNRVINSKKKTFKTYFTCFLLKKIYWLWGRVTAAYI